MFDMRDKLYNTLCENIMKNADVNEMNDIFSQIVKNNDTNYDCVKWSLKQLNEIGQMDRASRCERLNRLFDEYRFGNDQL